MKNITICLSALFLIVGQYVFSQTNMVNLPDWALGNFVRPANINPIIAPDSTTRFNCPMRKKIIDWESNDTFNPAAAVKDDEIVVLYRAEDKSGRGIGGRTSRLGYASSKDGFKFKRKTKPVFYPGEDSQKEMEWTGGCEDPRVTVAEDGTYVMLYTQWNQKCPRLAVATSKDLVNWTKFGPAFRRAYNGRFFNKATKSASMLTRFVGSKQVIAKIKGKYWMYWGEESVYAATSEDLTNWEPLVDEKGDLKVLMAPRKGYFDSQLTECGPPAILTDKGILLMYNGKNLNGDNGDIHFTGNSYCAGQVLFDLNEPTRVISRLDVPFYKPTETFEKSGQYPAGTVFVEGLVFFKGKWYLYYGCADSRVAVAVFDPRAFNK